MLLPRISLLAALLIACVPAACLHAEAGPVITDPAQAGPDFEIQGEYVGNVVTDDGEQRFGAQIVALGDGAFRLVGYTGGLPGDGWNKGDKRTVAEGKRTGKVARFEVPKASIEVRDGILSIIADGAEVGQLNKVHRKSPTLGAKPPEGALVLFDGRSTNAFTNGKLVDGKYLAATGCSSKKKFGDHSLHIEFRTPFVPKARGQGRGNSGVYVQSRYEIQVLDTFALEGEDNECGGIYKIAAPAVNMCFPPLAWQTYDYQFTAARYDKQGKKTKNARITVRHNGVVIHDNLELATGTPGRHAEGPGPDALFLQYHGNPVVYRNIWAVDKAPQP